jgi:hypothetical protein
MMLHVGVDVLRHSDVPFTLDEQQAGDLIVTAPGTIHRGWNGGANIAIAVNWGDGLTCLRMANYVNRHARCVPYTRDKQVLKLA